MRTYQVSKVHIPNNKLKYLNICMDPLYYIYNKRVILFATCHNDELVKKIHFKWSADLHFL